MIKFNEIRDGQALMASHINGYGYLFEHILADAELTQSSLITQTLELDAEASRDHFTGESLYNVYRLPNRFITELSSLVVTRQGQEQTETPLSVDWLAGRVQVERSNQPLTIKATYRYAKSIKLPTGNKIPPLTVDNTPLYWPTMVDMDESGSLLLREDGQGKYLVTATPTGKVSAVRVVTEVIDELDSEDSSSALSANQGRILAELVGGTATLGMRALLAEPPSIDPSIVRDLVGCAMTYMNNRQSLKVGSSDTLFDPVGDEPTCIDGVALVQACIQGIPYEYSLYTGSENIQHFKYGITLEYNPYDVGRYTAQDLARYLQDNGSGFYPNIDYSNISPGDLIFVSAPESTSIDDVLIVIGYKDNEHLTCIRVDKTIEFYDLRLYSLTNPTIQLVARPAYNPTVGLDPRPLISDIVPGAIDNEGTLKTYTLPMDLKPNMPYTFVVKTDPSYTASNSLESDYVSLIATYNDYTTQRICSWRGNQKPKDGLYYMKFVTGAKPVIQLTLVVDDMTTYRPKVELVQLYEGLVRPTKLLSSPRDRVLYTRLPEASACYRGRIAVMDNGSGVDAAYICLHVGDNKFRWFGLESLPTNSTSKLGLGIVGSLLVE